MKAEVDWVLEHRRDRVIPVLLDSSCDPTGLHLELRLIQHLDLDAEPDDTRGKLIGLLSPEA